MSKSEPKCKLLCDCPDFSLTSPIHKHPEIDAMMCSTCNKFLSPYSLKKARETAKPPEYKEVKVSYKKSYAIGVPWGWHLQTKWVTPSEAGEMFGTGGVTDDM